MILDGFIFLINHTGYQTLSLTVTLYGYSQHYSNRSKSI
jgi:hypothetical protein